MTIDESITRAITQLETTGQPVSANAVFRITGGSRPAVLAAFAARKAGGAAPAPGSQPGAGLDPEPGAEEPPSPDPAPGSREHGGPGEERSGTKQIRPDWRAAHQALQRLQTARQGITAAVLALAQLETAVDDFVLKRFVARERDRLRLVPEGPFRTDEDPTPVIAFQNRYREARSAVGRARDTEREAREAFTQARAAAVDAAQKRWLRAQYPTLAQQIDEAMALCDQVPDSATANQVARVRWGVLLSHRAEAPSWSGDGPVAPA